MRRRTPDARLVLRGSRRARAGISLLLMLPLLAGALGAPAATADDLDDAVAQRKAIAARIQAQHRQVAQLTATMGRVQDAIDAAKKKLSGINANLAEVQRDVATMRANIALVRASYGNLVDQLEGIDRQLRVLQADERRRATALIQRREVLAERVREAYAAGRVTLLETLLSADSFTEALAQFGYYLDMGLQDEALARQIVTDIREVDELRQQIRGTQVEIEGLRDEIAERRTQLDGQLVELKDAETRIAELRRKAKDALVDQRTEYERLAKNKAALAAAIAKSTAARASLTDRIDAIVAQKKKEREDRIRAAREREAREREAARRAASGSGSGSSGAGTTFRSIPSRYNGTLIWPMSGYISQEYGCTGFGLEPPRNGCAHWHSGIDIVAPYGTAVRAAAAGEVLYVGWNYADGYDPAWIVIIAHSDNMQTWYGHLQPMYPVRAGHWVGQGQVIGYEGNTGRSTGPHLHWMVRVDGTFLNPRLFV